MAQDQLIEKIVSLAKRRGFVFPGSEIYGGIGGIYDLGPLGVELANNIKAVWWKNIVYSRDNVVGLDSSILMNSSVWHASGHVEGFVDPLIECKKCNKRFRKDVYERLYEAKKRLFKKASAGGGNPVLTGEEMEVLLCKDGVHRPQDFTGPRLFNLMFKTHIGPVEDESSETFLR